jgi:hypothetical protein
MRLYREAPQGSIKMSDDPALVAAIDAAIKNHGIRIAVETGTFDGTGSTRMIAECLCRSSQPISYITLEISFYNWCFAYRNLRPFLFVDCRWGCSVDREGAIEFIRKDEALNNHHKYPDIYIDDIENPVGFYLNELNGMLGRSSRAPRTGTTVKAPLLDRARRLLKSIAAHRISNFHDSAGTLDLATQLWSGEALLSQFLRMHHDNRPLVILDSAGGCGLYEFQIVMDVMRDAPFLLLLDDTHHLKHFRSLQHVKADPRFKLLNVSDYHGWALAWHE